MEELYGEGTPEHFSGRMGRHALVVYRDEHTGKYHRHQIEGIREHDRAEPERPNYRDYRSPTPPTPEPTEAEILTKSYTDSGKSAIAEKVAEIHPDLDDRDLYPQLPYEQYKTGPKRKPSNYYRAYGYDSDAGKGGAKAKRFSSHKEAKTKYLSLPASRQKDVGGITKTKLGYELRKGRSLIQAQDPKSTEKSFVLD